MIRSALRALGGRLSGAARKESAGVALTPGGAELAGRFAALRPAAGPRFFAALCNHLGGLRDDPCVGMYFEFAVTTNQRGRECARLLAAHASLRGARYLDVGCAYAGFLVAFAEQGAEVAGFDLDPQLLALAAHNLCDHGLAVTPRRLDLTSSVDMDPLAASQDVITCNDVMEHVAEPRTAVANLAAILRPGGLVYLEIPNRRFPPFVARDGHYQLFGITLLQHDDAAGYYAHVHPGRPYTVGHYLDLEDYERAFADVGLAMSVLPETFAGVTPEGTLEALEAVGGRAAEGVATVPPPFRARVDALVRAYLDEAAGWPRDEVEERQRFLDRYGPAFWRILARRPA